MSKYAIHTATNYEGTRNELRGCLNDWKNFRQLDKELGIPEVHTISLVGANYNATNATEAVSMYAKLMEPGDMLLGSNSSHGTQTVDLQGDELDGIDEALVTDRGELILDDDIFAGLKKFKTGTLVVAWLDNCFSGTMDRAFLQKNWHLMDPEVRCDAVFLFGCKENQTAADAFINGQFQGALTYCSLTVLRDAGFDLTYLELLDRTNDMLRRRHYSQVAQLAVTSEDLLHKKVFQQ